MTPLLPGSQSSCGTATQPHLHGDEAPEGLAGLWATFTGQQGALKMAVGSHPEVADPRAQPSRLADERAGFSRIAVMEKAAAEEGVP